MRGAGRPSFMDLTQRPIVRCSIRLVAAARSGLEATPVKNRYVPAAVADQFARLQGTCRLGHTDAADAQHEGEELLRDVEAVCVRAILRHQEPPRKPRLDHMKTCTAGRLRELAHMDEHIAVDFALQRRTAPEPV